MRRFLNKFIAFLLVRYTPFRVVAWDQGFISGIGYYPGPHQKCRQTLMEVADAD